MQTFLPHRSFAASMRCLDYRRLGKQRVEAYQILNTLTGKSKGWRNHPAVLMWRGHERALRGYLRCAILEWIKRGYNNSMRLPRKNACTKRPPPWLSAEFIASHRSNLLRKDAAYYGRFGWGLPADLPYVWPVQIPAQPASPARAKRAKVLSAWNSTPRPSPRRTSPPTASSSRPAASP